MKSSELPRTRLSFYQGFALHWESELVYSTIRPSAELYTLSLRSSIFETPKMSVAQILVISTTVDAKCKFHPNISNLGSEHQNKILAYKLLLNKITYQSNKCLKAPYEVIYYKYYEFYFIH